MALTWDVTKNKNAYREISIEEFKADTRSIFGLPKYDENDKYYQMTNECNLLIFLLGLKIGISDLTESNYERVYNRIHLIEAVNNSAFMSLKNPKTNKVKPHFFTLDMVKNNIGIYTNGITKSQAVFLKEVLGSNDL